MATVVLQPELDVPDSTEAYWPFRFTEEQYAQMTQLGWFNGQAVTFADGRVWELSVTNGLEPVLRRWSRHEYDQMEELCWFYERRVMMLDGEIIEMAQQNPRHYATIDFTIEVLRPAFGAGCWLRIQAPLDLPGPSDTEPDVAVVTGSVRDYIDHHPTTALLIVESSETTLRLDRKRKGVIYARAGILDYWIINLADRHLEVYRNPVQDQELGWYYKDVTILKPGDMISPLAAPQANIAVADLLP